MTLIDDIVTRMGMLANERVQWEIVWREIAKYCLPDHSRFVAGSTTSPTEYDQIARGPTSVERGRDRYDDTALRAVDRLAAGMESLVTPQSEKWHGLAVTDPLAPESTDEEKEYFETYRDYMFAVRYNPRSGFIGAHQKALRSSIGLGTGVVFIEENMGAQAHAIPALYRYLPLSECYLAIDAQGEPDTLFRKFRMTARQMVQRFGKDSVAEAVLRAASTQGQTDTGFDVIHAVQPRADRAGYGIMGAPWASVYIDRTNMKVMGESGFYEFPFVIYYWQPVENMPYAQSPVMLCLADVKGLNAIKKVSLKGLQTYMDPAWGIAHDGVMNRANLNPGRMNYGAVSKDGRPQILPLQSGARPDFVQEIVEGERKVVSSALYNDIFQILLQNPSMTATEAMIRSNEKGELLGPAGGKIQQAMAREVERLAGIMERKGAMLKGAALQPPSSLAGREFGARFTSPLDRLRRSAEGIGIQRTLQTVMPLIEADPEIMDNFDTDEISRSVTEIEGAPQKILRTIEERDAKRAARAQQQQQAQQMEMAQRAAATAKDAVPALAQANQLAQGGGLSPLAPLSPQAPAQ